MSQEYAKVFAVLGIQNPILSGTQPQLKKWHWNNSFLVLALSVLFMQQLRQIFNPVSLAWLQPRMIYPGNVSPVLQGCSQHRGLALRTILRELMQRRELDDSHYWLMTKILRTYDCTEILESGCILSGTSRAQSTFNIPWLTQDSGILCRRNGPISPYPSDIMYPGSKEMWWALCNKSRVLGKSRVWRRSLLAVPLMSPESEADRRAPAVRQRGERREETLRRVRSSHHGNT